MDAALSREPLTARLHLDAGFELIPHPPDDISTDLNIIDAPAARWSIGDLRYHYRAAFTMEAGAEADQEFDAAFMATGAGLRVLNLSRTGWSGWMPSALVMYERMFRITDVDNSPESAPERTFGRLRLVYRHQLDLGTLGLSGFTLAGGLQYTREFGQSAAYRDAGFHSRFGWVADLSRAILWQGRERSGRIDLFVRYSGGRIAPLVDSDRSFTLGLRLPYSR